MQLSEQWRSPQRKMIGSALNSHPTTHQHSSHHITHTTQLPTTPNTKLLSPHHTLCRQHTFPQHRADNTTHFKLPPNSRHTVPHVFAHCFILHTLFVNIPSIPHHIYVLCLCTKLDPPSTYKKCAPCTPSIPDCTSVIGVAYQKNSHSLSCLWHSASYKVCTIEFEYVS